MLIEDNKGETLLGADSVELCSSLYMNWIPQRCVFLIRAMDTGIQPQLPRSRAAAGHTMNREVSFRMIGLALKKRKSIMEGYRDVCSWPPPWNIHKITLYPVILCEVNWGHHNMSYHSHLQSEPFFFLPLPMCRLSLWTSTSVPDLYLGVTSSRMPPHLQEKSSKCLTTALL